MKKSSLKILILLFLSVTILSGCALKKMVKNYGQVSYEVIPSVLESHGGKIKVTIKGTIPAKYFDKKAIIEITPVLTYGSGSTKLKPIKLSGEKIIGDGVVMSKKTGGSFNYSQVIDYKPEMNASVLNLNAIVTIKKKSAELKQLKVADGVIYTSERIIFTPELKNKSALGNGTNVIVSDHGYVKETFVSENATIFYLVDRSNLDLNIPFNKKAENKEQIKKLIEFLKSDLKIKDITVNAWASPEGEEARNQDLSDSRSKTAQKWVKDQLTKFIKAKAKALKVDEKTLIAEVPEVTLNAKGEDWDGFMSKIETSEIKDKDIILNTIRSQSDGNLRQQEIRKMTVIYKEIEDQILPSLRRAIITINCYEKKKTDDQMSTMAISTPDSLNINEMLYAASIATDLNTKESIYRNVTKVFPNDWRGYNDLSAVLIMLNKLDEAKTMAKKADEINQNNGSVHNNIGVIAMLNKDYAAAKFYFESSEKLGVAQGYNLGILKIKDGEYSAAINLFAGKTCDYNVALAQVLLLSYDGAKQNLDCIKNKTAAVSYLLAIIGARTANTTIMFDNLKIACEDASFKSQAKEDREFLKYFSNSEFQAIVK